MYILINLKCLKWYLVLNQERCTSAPLQPQLHLETNFHEGTNYSTWHDIWWYNQHNIYWWLLPLTTEMHLSVWLSCHAPVHIFQIWGWIGRSLLKGIPCTDVLVAVHFGKCISTILFAGARHYLQTSHLSFLPLYKSWLYPEGAEEHTMSICLEARSNGNLLVHMKYNKYTLLPDICYSDWCVVWDEMSRIKKVCSTSWHIIGHISAIAFISV